MFDFFFSTMLALFAINCGVIDSYANKDDAIVANFEEGTYDNSQLDKRPWIIEGTAFGDKPATGALNGQMAVSGFDGKGLVNSFLNGDRSVGSLTSPDFKMTRDYLSFLIGGGKQPEVGAELIIDGKVVRTATGRDSETLTWQSWDVREYRGQTGKLRIFDRATGGWGHILFDELLLTDQPRQSPFAGRLSDYRRSEQYYLEPHRPGFHFTPEINWMNDPNGLVFFDGEYHLFYQHNPYANEWGHMSWGHAVSEDLLHWKHLPIALHDEYDLMAFSGSAVVDLDNRSGFGEDGKVPLVAIYTGHGFGKQTQDLAYSVDRGRTWTKYAGNPVIDIGEADFRDPKVFWYWPTSKWVMVVSLAAEKRIRFYSSSDLKVWNLLSEFGPAGVQKKTNWECPDLFELPIEGELQSRWVLEIGMGGGAIAGGSGGEYFTGEFDGERFVPDLPDSQWVDYGRDFYAATSWSDIPAGDGRRLWLGWMNNWETALNPTSPWRSAMSIPREVTLRRIDNRLRLCQTPVRELAKIRGKEFSRKSFVCDKVTPIDLQGQQLDIEVEFAVGTATEFGVRVLMSGQEQSVVGYDVAKQEVFIDRTRSGNVAFHPAFAGRHAGPLPARAGRVRMRIVVDKSSVEVFANDGETVLTDLVFPRSGSDGVEVFAKGGSCEVVKFRAWPLAKTMGE